MEYLDILDEKGNKTGKIASRIYVHQSGLYHKAVHIWFVNSQGEVLLQLRSMKKRNHPGLWDISVAGHVPAGESDISGAIREIEEEIGLQLESKELELIGVISQKSFNDGNINNEINPVFIVKKDLDLLKLKKQEDEVTDLKYISLEKLKSMVVNNDPQLVKHEKEFKLLFKYFRL